jgi:hypothetical protein
VTAHGQRDDASGNSWSHHTVALHKRRRQRQRRWNQYEFHHGALERDDLRGYTKNSTS